MLLQITYHNEVNSSILSMRVNYRARKLHEQPNISIMTPFLLVYLKRILMITLNRTLRKHAHMIYSDFSRSKIDNFQRKIFDIFLIFAQNIDCGYTLEPPRRGGSNEYPQSMFWSKNKKNRYTPAYLSFTI